jgi:hypothetical protein
MMQTAIASPHNCDRVNYIGVPKLLEAVIKRGASNPSRFANCDSFGLSRTEPRRDLQ